MREIKFRGKRVDNGKWVYGDLLRKSGETYIFLDLLEPKTVGQCIGRKDKNEKGIYEDDFVDVVMHEGVCNPSTKYLIEYRNAGFYLKAKNIEGDIGYVDICGYDCCIKSMEIIGNKHENPELSEEK